MPTQVMTIVGARPQFIKAGAVSRAILARSDLTEIMVHTGQHPDDNMSKVFFDELDIPAPAHELKIQGKTHGEATGRMLIALEAVMREEKPDWVIVYGDTNSTLAGALAAAKLHIPILHVEAGLRSFNRRMPEEINRVLTDHIATLLMCPSRLAVANLKDEGITKGVHHMGDVMYDATLFATKRAEESSRIIETLGLAEKAYAVATVHRPSNVDDPARLHAVMAWLTDRTNEQVIVFPVHPRTRRALKNAGIEPQSLSLIDPLGHLDMSRLIAGATEIYTDSGGLQKEAYFHGKPCVTLRDETEWVELVEYGWNKLWTVKDYKPRREMTEYGTGHAAEAILDHLITYQSGARGCAKIGSE